MTRDSQKEERPPASATDGPAASTGGEPFPPAVVTGQSLLEMTPELYDELRRLAANYLRGERSEHTLQRTALVHEAFLKLVEEGAQKWQNQAHFMGVFARLMRQTLINHAVAPIAFAFRPVPIIVPSAGRWGSQNVANAHSAYVLAPASPFESKAFVAGLLSATGCP